MLPVDDRIAQIVQRYSHLFVECDDSEVQDFYLLLSLYFAKCDGLLSPAQVRRLESTARGLVTFSPYLTSVHEKESIISRLSFLKKHNVNKPDDIMRMLMPTIFASGRFRTSDGRYLVEFTENPAKSLKWYANKLNVNVSSVARAYQRLRKAIDFWFYSHINYPLFRLKHLLLFFKPDEPFRSSMLSTREFTITLNCDTFGEWKWASFLVPNQDRIIKEFEGGLACFASKFLRDYRLYEIKAVGKYCNLSMFDGEKWLFSEESFGIRFFEHAEANKDVLPRLEEFVYDDGPIRFDQLDFLLSVLMAGDFLARSSELRRVIREYGYTDVSSVTISRRLAALKRNRAFFPYSYFSGLGLSSMLAFAAECDDKTVETLFCLFPMLPECYASRTDKGVVGFVMMPANAVPSVYYMLQGLRGKVDDLIVTSRFRNLGSRIRPDLRDHWNAERQYWDFERGFFDLSNYDSNSSKS